MLPFRVTALGVLCGLCATFGASGCGKTPTTEIASPTAENLHKLHDAYQRTNIRLGRPPLNLSELMPDLKQQGKPEEILRSPNDGADFEIVWGVSLVRLKERGNDVPVIAFEKRGKGGKRHVLRARDRVEELSESQLKSAKFPEGYTLPPL